MSCCTVKTFGTAIRQLREQQQWSQEQLAEQADLNRSYIGEIERGQVVVSLLTIEKLAAALGVPSSRLLAHGEAITQRQTAQAIELMAIAC